MYAVERNMYTHRMASGKLTSMFELLDILRCPATGSRLHAAEPSLLERLNQAISAGRVHDRLGRQVTRELDSALINADSTLGYPIYDRIPSLVADESIPLGQVSDEKEDQRE